MRPIRSLLIVPVLWAAACSTPNEAPREAAAARTGRADEVPLEGWLSWRGPDQNGTSPEEGLFEEVTLGGKNHLWSYEMSGRGTPTIADGRIFALGYTTPGPSLEEVLFCLDEETGKLLWERRFSDFLSDVVYTRYALGSPTVDPETGNLYAMTGAGLLHGFTRDGDLLWQVSMMETLGRLTFPNGRTGAPLILGDLVIIHFIFASWGPDFGPASDRFFAFDKHTGEVVWGSTPSLRPIDGSFSTPVVEERDGRMLFYAGLGGGKLVCVDALTGDPVWRFTMSNGGLNSSALLYGDNIIAIHGKENLDSSAIGRMISLKLGVEPSAEGDLPASAEVWRNPLVAFTSSPVLVGNRVYVTDQTGELCCVNADTGAILWKEKLGPDQLHASPVYADGKLYVPITNGSFHIIRPTDEGAEILDQVQLEGTCLAAPAVANGRVYVHTTEKLYCFGEKKHGAPTWHAWEPGKAGEPTRLQIVPFDTTAHVGEVVPFVARRLDAHGRTVDEIAGAEVSVELPPVAAGSAAGTFTGKRVGVGVVKASYEGAKGTARVRFVPTLPYTEDFEAVELDQADGKWAFPPGHWLGGRLKWKIIEKDGGKVAVRRMEIPLFQRTMTLVGHPDDASYTVQADLMSDGNRRTIGSMGVVNQRYLIMLKGNYQELEVSSNEEHIKVGVPFEIRPEVWYRLKTRVDIRPDGTAVVRAKAWPRDEAEPDAWTTEVEDPNGHTHGAAGLYGFTPQSRFATYVDNFTVTPNEK